MRFFLDNDVDAAVASMLRRKRHQAWTAEEAGLAAARDDDLSVYAHTKRAVLLTHDREFTTRRRRSPIGQHVRLACAAWDAVEVLRRDLAALEVILRARPAVTVVLSKSTEPLVLEQDWR